MEYKVNTSHPLTFRSTLGEQAVIPRQAFVDAARETRKLAEKISEFPVNIFEILGMRNLSSFVGELFAASLKRSTGSLFKKNPHQDGYPDLLLMNEKGRQMYEQLAAAAMTRSKQPFSPFANGGIEIKATCGSVPTPAVFARKKLGVKPDIGDQRISVLQGYDWKAHHRETNNLVGILWDFIDQIPTVAAVFLSPDLTKDDWGKIVQPKEGGGKTTSVSIMKKEGVKKMYKNWVVVIDDQRYIKFLNQYNSDSLVK